MAQNRKLAHFLIDLLRNPLCLIKCIVFVSLYTLVSLLQCPIFAEESKKNSIIVCDNGLEMFDWDLDFLKEAQQSVEVLACFLGGAIAQQLLHIIELKLQETPAIQIHILASPILLEEKDWALIYKLQNNYPRNFHIAFSVQVAKLYPDLISTDNHVKLFVIDETYFSTGGTNLEDKHCSEGTYSPPKEKGRLKVTEALLPLAMRDQDIVGRGPLAKDLRKLFYQLYAVWENFNETCLLKDEPDECLRNNHYFEIDAKPIVARFENSKRIRKVDPDDIKLFLGGPHQKINAVTQEYIHLIQQAKEEIILEHLYFLPIDPILDALMEAVNRGVKIKLITNGLSRPHGSQLFCWGNRMSYVPLFYGNTFHFWNACEINSIPPKNTQIFEYHVEDVWLHKKIMLVDNKIFVVGSYNLGIKSAYGDYELILVINSDEIARDVRQVFLKDIKFSKNISPQQACEWYFDPLISYWGSFQKKFSGFM